MRELHERGLDVGGKIDEIRKRCSESGISIFNIKIDESATREVNLKKCELQELLTAKNLNSFGTVNQLQKHCGENNIATTKTVNIVTEGWVGKAKGIKQILWERGWLDATKLNQYKKEMPKDEFGNDVEEFCLPKLIKKQPDFINELTSLQHMAKEFGSEVECTPKCHPEMAGEGIEYIWAKAKQWYWKFPAEEKKVLQIFRG